MTAAPRPRFTGILRTCIGGVCWAIGGCVWAESATISSSLTVTETITSGSDGRGSDAVTVVSPSVVVTNRSGPLQGSLSYTANGVLHANGSGQISLSPAMAGGGNLQIVPQRFGVNVNAGISQQTVSAFGAQTADPLSARTNQSNVYQYSIAPYLRGQLLGQVNYNAQLAYASSRSGSTDTGDTSSLSGTVGLSGGVGKIGWSLDASRLMTDVPGGLHQFSGRYGGGLTFRPDFEWLFSLRAAKEVSDLRTGNVENTTSWGLGAHWTPGPRTTVDLQADRRYFGNSHGWTLSHRMARTVWTFSDTKDLSLGGASGRGSISLYDLYFVQFASLEPDPVKRDALVRAFLTANGLNPGSTVVVGGFLSNTASVQHRQSATMGYQALRASFSLSYFRSQSTRFGINQGPEDDLSRAGTLRQYGYTVSVSHRLSPTSSLVLSGSQQTTPDAGTIPGNDLKTITATWSDALGHRSSVSLSARYSIFSSQTNAYHESALIGSFSMWF